MLEERPLKAALTKEPPRFLPKPRSTPRMALRIFRQRLAEDSWAATYWFDDLSIPFILFVDRLGQVFP